MIPSVTKPPEPAPAGQPVRAGNVPAGQPARVGAAPPQVRQPSPPQRPQQPSQPQQPQRQQYLDLKANVHRKLLDRLNLEALAQADRTRVEGEIRTLINDLLNEEGIPISLSERETLFSELMDDVFGFGPLEPLLRDPTINDILVNTYKNVFVERHGQLERVTLAFRDDRHLLRVIDRIVSGVGRRVDDSSPMVDRKSTRLNSSHITPSRMPSSA